MIGDTLMACAVVVAWIVCLLGIAWLHGSAR
jgi:hypothetical protein